MVRDRKPPQQRLAAAREPEQDFPAILAGLLAPDGAMLGEPVNQLDGAVMLDLQPLSELTNRRAGAFRQAFDRKQQLVLRRLEPILAGRVGAELQEAANLVAEFRQSAVFPRGEIGGSHTYIVSRYNRRCGIKLR